jgi:hypothetical protein
VALSDKHIQRHLREWTDLYLSGNDDGGGGHSGMSLNIFCGLLAEPPKRVVRLALDLKITYKKPKNPVYFWAEDIKQWVKYKNCSDFRTYSVGRNDALLPGGFDPYEYCPEEELIETSQIYFVPNT